MKKYVFNLFTIAVFTFCWIACDKENLTETPPNEEVIGRPLDFDIFTNLSFDGMAYVEGGSFYMGAQYSKHPNKDSKAYTNESPVHKVTLSPYYIGRYEVTQELWEYVMNYSNDSTLSAVSGGPWLGENPSDSYGAGSYYPAYNISYNDIVNCFLPRLNKLTGKKFRLPTEAEWEYAARGGQKEDYTRIQGKDSIRIDSIRIDTTIYDTVRINKVKINQMAMDTTNIDSIIIYTIHIDSIRVDSIRIGDFYPYNKYSGSSSIENVAWYYDNSNNKTHPVGGKQANALGLYDMTGNVWEWCSDWYDDYSSNEATNPTGPATGSNRIYRGGSWNYNDIYSRISFRFQRDPSLRACNLGFRLAHDVE